MNALRPRRPRRSALLPPLLLAAALTGCAATPSPVAQPYPDREDVGERPAFTYFFRRARVQLTRDLARTELPALAPLDFAALAGERFAVAWIGHATQLVRVAERWILIDPALGGYVGPLDFFGPERLTPLPFALGDLPRIDLVLISHGHPEHLDHRSIRLLAAQAGGPPRFLVPRGVGAWLAGKGVSAVDEFEWWSAATIDRVTFTFTPAQHGSGRRLGGKNRTLWGGWMIALEDRRFYFAGDTAYSTRLFNDIQARLGAPDLAALPNGAYEPRRLMRFEHMNPADPVQAHRDLRATRSFGVHWATFQLGDEEPIQPARDLAVAVRQPGRPEVDFVTVPVGGVLRVDPRSPAPPRL